MHACLPDWIHSCGLCKASCNSYHSSFCSAKLCLDWWNNYARVCFNYFQHIGPYFLFIRIQFRHKTVQEREREKERERERAFNNINSQKLNVCTQIVEARKKNYEVPQSNVCHGSVVPHNDILQDYCWSVVKRGDVYARSVATRVGGKKLMIPRHSLRLLLSRISMNARTEMKSSSISFESWPYDKFVLMTRHVFVSTFMHTHPTQCWRNSCERSWQIVLGIAEFLLLSTSNWSDIICRRARRHLDFCHADSPTIDIAYGCNPIRHPMDIQSYAPFVYNQIIKKISSTWIKKVFQRELLHIGTRREC